MKLQMSFIGFYIILSSLVVAQGNNQQERIVLGSRYSDSLSLVDFFHSTNGALWKEKWNFNESLDNWYGVSLNNLGRVFCIDLDGDPNCSAKRFGGNHLHGELIDLQLPYLEHLFLSSNQLSGSIPDFSNTPYLLSLQISANQLTGQIPDFMNLKYLIKLDLEWNKLEGSIPEFSDLPKLESLYLGHNHLTGSVPNFEFSVKLKQIFLENNKLIECRNDFSNLRELQQIILANNWIQSQIPKFNSTSKLRQLDLSNNEFYGCLDLDKYTDIALFDWSKNDFTTCIDYEVFVPNAISPNGDGQNDYWKLSISKPNVPLEIFVFDRRKKVVFATKNYKNNWGGVNMNTNKLLENGVYYYQLKIGKTDIRSGWLLIKYN